MAIVAAERRTAVGERDVHASFEVLDRRILHEPRGGRAEIQNGRGARCRMR